jgi:hypothetical protein
MADQSRHFHMPKKMAAIKNRHFYASSFKSAISTLRNDTFHFCRHFTLPFLPVFLVVQHAILDTKDNSVESVSISVLPP